MITSDIEVTLIDSMGTDLSVVNAARVSFDKESEFANVCDKSLKVADKKLINYLAEHKHLSPFNHTFISFRVKAPIFVSRQLVKHEYMPWNEFSRRYVNSEPEFYIPNQWRAKAENVKQGSSDEVIDILIEHGTSGKNGTENPFDDSVEIALETYNYLLQKGVCAEQARMVLPQNTMTEWIWSGTLGAVAKMLRLRLDPHTQYETRIVAEKIRDIVQPLFPVSLEALLKIK